MDNRISNIIETEGYGGLFRKGIDHLGWHIKKAIIYKRFFNTYLKLTKKHTEIDPLVRVWVDPDSIKFVAGQLVASESKSAYHFHQPSFPSQGKNGLGTVVGGNWDQKSVRFEELEEYKMLKQRIVEDHQWEETEFFKQHMNEVSVPDSVNTWGKKRLNTKLSRIDDLIQSISSNGVVPHECYNGHFLDEIIVYLGRDGSFYWNENGRHRLAIAKILDIDLIPVLITVRHKKAVYGDYTIKLDM